MTDGLKLLFEQIAEGNEQAFKRLFDQWYDLLFHTALAYLKIPDLANDTTQQTFLRIWERREILREVNDPDSWLFTAARNQAFTMLKQEARRIEQHQVIIQQTQEAEANAEELLIHTQTEQLIQQSLQQLTEKQRQAYILNRYEGLSFRQIAELWGVRTDTIKEHIGKAVKEIRQFLQQRKDDLLFLLTSLLTFFYS